MTMAKAILGIVPGVMSLSLLGKPMATIPKGWGLKGTKKVEPLHMVKGFTGIMVGIPMIKVVSTQVAAL